MSLSQLRALAESQAVKVFTDRENYTQSFDHWFGRHLDGRDRMKVLVFYGVGGIGKSRLLHELVKRASRYAKDVRTIRLDFDSDELDSAAVALGAFRRQWGGSCPLFDFALGRFWQMSGRSVESIRKHALPSDGLLYELTNYACSIASAGFFSLGVLKELLKKEEKLRRWYSPLHDKFEELESLPTADLALRLPLLLGDAVKRSANESLEPQPLLVCVDGYERLLARDNFKLGKMQGDGWLRELVACSEYGLYVICGRNRIQWPERNPEWEQHIDQHLLGELGSADADEFLRRIPVTEPEVRDTIIRSARGVPLFLDLCASIYVVKKREATTVSASDFDGAHADVIDRFLSCLDRDQAEAVRALSVLESFDRRVFAAVTGALNVHIPMPRYVEFCAASYATDGDPDTDVRAIHPIVRDYLRESVGQEDLIAIIQAAVEDMRQSAVVGDMWRVARVLASLAPAAARLDDVEGRGPWATITECAIDLADAGFPTEAAALATVLAANTKSSCLGAYAKLIRAHCLRRTGDLQAARDLYAVARAEMPASANPGIVLLCEFHSAHVDHMLGNYAIAKQKYVRIVSDYRAVTGAENPLWLARRQLGDIDLLTGRFKDALECLRACEQKGPAGALWKLECRRFVAHVYRFNWMLDEARDIYLDVMHASEANGLVGMHAKALVNLAETCWSTDPVQAFEWGSEASRRNEDAGNLVEVGKALTAVALAQVALGNQAAAREYLERAGAIHDRTGYRSGHAFVQVARCFLAFAEGDLESASKNQRLLEKLTGEMGVYAFLRATCAMVWQDPSTRVAIIDPAFQWLDLARLSEALTGIREHLRMPGQLQT